MWLFLSRCILFFEFPVYPTSNKSIWIKRGKVTRYIGKNREIAGLIFISQTAKTKKRASTKFKPTFYISFSNFRHESVTVRCQNFDEDVLISAEPVHGIVQFLGVELGRWHHQSEYGLLEVALELRLELRDQAQVVIMAELVRYLETLGIAPGSEDVYEGVLQASVCRWGIKRSVNQLCFSFGIELNRWTALLDNLCISCKYYFVGGLLNYLFIELHFFYIAFSSLGTYLRATVSLR